MSWNARIVKKKAHWVKLSNGKKMWIPAIYGIHEVYYNKRGKPDGCTIDAMDITGESVEDCKVLFDLYAKAFDKSVLKYEDFGRRKS